MIQNNFFIITPVFNSEKWIQRCIESVINQTYKNWKMCIIDDASTDNTKKIIDEYKSPQVEVIFNQNRIGSPLANIVKGINQIVESNEDIIIVVDGDDKLYKNTNIEFLNNIYQNKSLWMTYGDYQTLSGESSQNKLILNTRKYRQSRMFYTSHLRTMKMKAWSYIDDNDLRDEDGEYFKVCGDMAILYPLVELCGLKRIQFLTELLISYNDLSPLNEFKINLPLLEQTREKIWNKRIYNEIIEDI